MAIQNEGKLTHPRTWFPFRKLRHYLYPPSAKCGLWVLIHFLNPHLACRILTPKRTYVHSHQTQFPQVVAPAVRLKRDALYSRVVTETFSAAHRWSAVVRELWELNQPLSSFRHSDLLRLEFSGYLLNYCEKRSSERRPKQQAQTSPLPIIGLIFSYRFRFPHKEKRISLRYNRLWLILRAGHPSQNCLSSFYNLYLYEKNPLPPAQLYGVFRCQTPRFNR